METSASFEARSAPSSYPIHGQEDRLEAYFTPIGCVGQASSLSFLFRYFCCFFSGHTERSRVIRTKRFLSAPEFPGKSLRVDPSTTRQKNAAPGRDDKKNRMYNSSGGRGRPGDARPTGRTR